MVSRLTEGIAARQLAERALLPARNLLEEVGEMMLLTRYYGYNASGGPVGVGEATAKSMVLNLVLVTLIGMLGTQIFWGTNPRAPVGG
jgi:hypothetical protein